MSAPPVHIIPGGQLPMLHSGPMRPPHGISVVVVVVASVVGVASGAHEQGPEEPAGKHVSPGGHEPEHTGPLPPHSTSVVAVESGVHEQLLRGPEGRHVSPGGHEPEHTGPLPPH